jgi:hypothetical protein
MMPSPGSEGPVFGVSWHSWQAARPWAAPSSWPAPAPPIVDQCDGAVQMPQLASRPAVRIRTVCRLRRRSACLPQRRAHARPRGRHAGRAFEPGHALRAPGEDGFVSLVVVSRPCTPAGMALPPDPRGSITVRRAAVSVARFGVTSLAATGSAVPTHAWSSAGGSPPLLLPRPRRSSTLKASPGLSRVRSCRSNSNHNSRANGFPQATRQLSAGLQARRDGYGQPSALAARAVPSAAV